MNIKEITRLVAIRQMKKVEAAKRLKVKRQNVDTSLFNSLVELLQDYNIIHFFYEKPTKKKR